MTASRSFTRMYTARLPDVEAGFFHSAHQLGGRNTVRLREAYDCSESGALQSSFKSAQNRSVYPELNKNVHLRETFRFPNFAQYISEGPFRA
jgi:hypothetical protein